MSEIEKIYNDFVNGRTAEQNRQERNTLNEWIKKIGVDLNDNNIYFSVTEHIANIEKNSFTDGFKQTVKLMTECFTAE